MINIFWLGEKMDGGGRGRLGGEERKNYYNQKGRRERRRREGGQENFSRQHINSWFICSKPHSRTINSLRLIIIVHSSQNNSKIHVHYFSSENF